MHRFNGEGNFFVAAHCYTTQSVYCVVVTPVSNAAEVDEPIEMPFGMKTCVCPGKHAVYGHPNACSARGTFECENA